MSTQQLNDIELQKLIELLGKLEPGFLPFNVFLQIARLTTLSIIEFVPLRLSENGNIEILLLSRGSDDPIWPDELHVPGTVIRPTDTEGKMYLAFERILNDELQGTNVTAPHYVGSILHKSKRGTEQAQVFWVEVLGEPLIGQFYGVDSLPENVMHSQLRFIKQAAKNFQEANSGTLGHA